MRPTLGRFARTSFFALTFASCRSEPPQRTIANATPNVSAVRVVPSATPRPPEKPEVSLCRVIAVRSLAGADAGAGAGADAGADAGAGRTLAVGAIVDGNEWLELGGQTEVVLRHSLTTRELALRGPGRFVPCFVGTETVLVARGSVKTTAGAGARAGAEVVLATPFGTLHFADAALELRVADRELLATVETGTVTLVPAGPLAADGGTPELTLGARGRKKLGATVEPKKLIALCEAAARPLETPPPRPVAGVPSARAALGEWSVAQLRARQAARWACATARAAIGRENDPERKNLWDEIGTVDRVWQVTR
jgi:hypothetical protein